jgi:hypothetical protein
MPGKSDGAAGVGLAVASAAASWLVSSAHAVREQIPIAAQIKAVQATKVLFIF